MEQLKGALLFGQSGGPTAVINASALGVFEEAAKYDCITKIYGASHGIKGILFDELFDIDQEDPAELALLKNTPSSVLGSVRYKLKPPEEDDSDYRRILEVFTKYDIRYFLYNGGNDSMDTCYKIGKYLTDHNYPCKIIGVPKTIDNDLFGTDHCPGYGSAAKYIATSCMELARDSRVYDKGSITVIEVMGRNAGWLTAASAVASYKGWGPDLIYVPELPFDLDDFLAEVKEVFVEKGDCMVVVSEGIRDREDKYISEYQKNAVCDSFNHIQLGGVGSFLAALVKQSTNAKVRSIEFSLLQRCAAHIASKTDVDEAYLAGAEAVKAAVNGKSNIMIAFGRAETKEYKLIIKELPLEMVANTEKKLPEDYLCSDRHFITEKFMDYVLPLIDGEAYPPFVDGVPHFATLKRVKTR